MHDLILNRPDNVRGPFGSYVTHDVYHIAERLAEISPHLMVSAHEPRSFGPKTWNYTISELTPYGEKLVFRAESLDARVVEHIEYLAHVPWEKRFAEMEREEAKWEAVELERQREELLETVGIPMLPQLERCGFIQRPVSYPKRGVAQPHRLRLPNHHFPGKPSDLLVAR